VKCVKNRAHPLLFTKRPHIYIKTKYIVFKPMNCTRFVVSSEFKIRFVVSLPYSFLFIRSAPPPLCTANAIVSCIRTYMSAALTLLHYYTSERFRRRSCIVYVTVVRDAIACKTIGRRRTKNERLLIFVV